MRSEHDDGGPCYAGWLHVVPDVAGRVVIRVVGSERWTRSLHLTYAPAHARCQRTMAMGCKTQYTRLFPLAIPSC
eukprot:scaffold230785_cov30-Tisochrysis_lutea.AAC.2